MTWAGFTISRRFSGDPASAQVVSYMKVMRGGTLNAGIIRQWRPQIPADQRQLLLSSIDTSG
jgi:hypothetical protein